MHWGSWVNCQVDKGRKDRDWIKSSSRSVVSQGSSISQKHSPLQVSPSSSHLLATEWGNRQPYLPAPRVLGKQNSAEALAVGLSAYSPGKPLCCSLAMVQVPEDSAEFARLLAGLPRINDAASKRKNESTQGVQQQLPKLSVAKVCAPAASSWCLICFSIFI